MSKRRNKAEWQRLIEEQAASDLTQKAFCERLDIAPATFGYWKRKLRAEAPSRSEEPAEALRVSLDDWIELAAPVSARPSGWHIELDLGGGLCLRLRRGA